MKKEFRIGEVITIGLSKCIVEKAGNTCVGCMLYKNSRCIDSEHVITGNCDFSERSDSQDVIFKRIGHVDEQICKWCEKAIEDGQSYVSKDEHYVCMNEALREGCNTSEEFKERVINKYKYLYE